VAQTWHMKVNDSFHIYGSPCIEVQVYWVPTSQGANSFVGRTTTGTICKKANQGLYEVPKLNIQQKVSIKLYNVFIRLGAAQKS